MLIPNKYNGYSRDGRRLYFIDMGSEPSTPEKTTQVTDLPDWAKPYAKEALEKGRALSNTPYQAYGGERIAGFSPMQLQAQQSAAGLDAGPQGFQQNIGSYMSPYMQNVVDVQKQEAARQSKMAGMEQAAGAVQRGAFGGSRDALMRAERERNLAQQMGDIQARGSQAAYEQAANQFRQGIGQQQGVIGLQSQLGGQEQALRQQGLTQAYQDFQNQQQHPYTQLGFYADMIRGLPLGQQSTRSVYQAPGSTMGQLAGLGMGAYGLSRMGAFAEGGEVDSYADGGVTSQGNVENILSKLSDQQLDAARQAAMSRRDVGQLQLIEAELAERASMRNGLGAGITDEYADHLTEQYADGGIVAFADGGVNDPYLGTEEKYNIPSLSQIKDFLTPKAALENRQRYERGLAEEKAKAAATAKPPTTSTAGAGRGSYKGYNPAADIKTTPTAKAEPKLKAAKEAPIEIPAGIKAVAAEKGFSEDDLMASMKRMKEYLKSENADELKGLQDMIEKQSGKSKEIKEQALGKALAEYGFAVAAGAAKPGARFLESAAGAAPTLSASVAESQKLMQAAEENAARLQVEYTKYKIALDKSDTSAAIQHASNVRQLEMAQQQINLKRQELANQAAYQQGSLGLQKQAMQQKTDQFNQLLGVKGATAAAQGAQAQARLADVRRRAVSDFDNANRRKEAELIQQLGPIQGQYQYKQLRNQYINDVLQQQADTAATANSGARAKSVFDLLED